MQWDATYLLTCVPNLDSNQPAHSRCLIRVFVVCMKKLCILVCLKCAQWRFWSDCTNAQADLNPCWAHMLGGIVSDVSTQQSCAFSDKAKTTNTHHENMPIYYEKTPIQIYWKFHHQKLKVSRYSNIFHISAQNIHWAEAVLTSTHILCCFSRNKENNVPQ